MVSIGGAERSSRGWLDFAAYVTWMGLAMLGLTTFAFELDLAPWRRWLGLISMFGVIGLGVVHLRSRATERRLGWRWGSIGLQSVLALTSVAAFHEQTMAVFLIIIMSIAAESGHLRTILLWLVLTNVALLAILFWMLLWVHAVVSFPLFLGFQLFAFAMSNAVSSERQTREQLAGVNAELLATRRLLQESARTEERLRISRELHDVAGHGLTALKLNLRSLMTRSDAEPEKLARCYDLSDELLRDIRSVVHQLRVADDIDVPGALSLLRHQHPDLEIDLDVEEHLEVDGIEVAEAIVRSTQEAITNALRHGRARRIWITLAREAEGIVLTIRDDGVGGAPTGSGHGLIGMRERAQLLGGTFDFDHSSGGGWKLRLTLPRRATA